MADDWAAFNPQSAPATENDDWAAFKPQAAPAQSSRVAEGFSALQDRAESESIPHAFIDRIASGALVMRDMFGYTFDLGKSAGKHAIESTVEQAGSVNERLNPFSEAYQAGRESGAWTGPGTQIGVGKGLFDAATLPLAPLGGALTELIAKPYSDVTRMPIDEAREAASTALLAMRPGSGNTPTFSRSVKQGEVVRDQPIGPMPRPEDFKTGAQVLGGEATEANLQRAWHEDGAHPAEAVHDAANDAFVKHDLTAPIEAYHGSPHNFEAFSTEKIGTGEGAQSYGHGLYFAENAEVAKGYSKIGVKFYEPTQRAAKDVLERNSGDRDAAVGELRSEIARGETHEGIVNKDSVIKLLEDGWSPPPENTYRVNIHADREHFLDFDKPLSGQNDYVKTALAPLVDEQIAKLEKAERAGVQSPIVRDLLKDFKNGNITVTRMLTHLETNKEKQSQMLSDLGIPGIKYLDQGSRPTGGAMTSAGMKLNPPAPTRNLVVFDDKAVEITHKNGEPFYDPKFAAAQNQKWLEHVLSGEGESVPLRALGADITTDPPLVSLEKQPASPPGSLLSAGRAAVDQLYGLGRNIQFMLDPMATGSNRAMAIAKDAMNSVRRIRWDHARIDAEAVKTFEPEARARMWNAADEESVALQLGESREHQGLVTLEPAERAFIEDAHTRAQSAWLNAVDAGMIEGEGLPAYTPRMVMNVAAASADMAPRALNELGRNVFTRTAQMNRRGYMTAEETEAAAKRLVGKRMAERGASMDEINAALEKVKIARDIRALPLATARLQEATVWRDMINKVEDVGKQTGSETVAVGYKPDNSWFTIAGNPAFTKWEPLLEKGADGKFMVKMDQDGNPIMAPKPIYMHPEFRGPMTSILDESVNKSKVEMGAQSLYGGLMALKGKSMTAILNSPLIHNEVVWSKVMEAAGGREWLGFNLYFKGNRIVNGNPARAGELIERGLNPMGPRGSFQDITSMMEQPNIESRYHTSWTGKIAGFIPGLFDASAGTAVESAIAKAGNFFHNTLLWDRVRDVQFGLADHLSDRLVGKGVDRVTADRVAGHFSNIIVGSIPKEAMSAGARATANMLLFSRSFTLGNLSTFKQAAMGLPKPILAQIERDFGISAEGNTFVGYHGTHEVFDSFSDKAMGSGVDAPFTAGKGHFFSTDPQTASGYAEGTAGAGNVRRAQLSFENPKVIEFGEHKVGNLAEHDEQIASLIDAAQKAGHDGLVLKGIKGQEGKDLIVSFGQDAIQNLPFGTKPSIPAAEAITDFAKSIARRKAISTIALSAGLYYTGNALIQHAFNILSRDATLNDEMQGYVRRYQSLMSDAKTDPWELRHLIGRLSPTYDNEPNKQDRAHVGYDKDGSAIYARNPTGKFGEEMVGYPTMPMSMVRRKLSPLAGGILDILENDRGFGRKIYDENDRTVGGDVATAVAVAKHLVMKHLPEGQITAAVDLLRGDGDPTMNKLRLVSPALGFTVSGGAPGGMARGEAFAAKQQFDAKFGLAWPDIKKQIQRGDIDGARSAMDNIQVPPQMQKGLIRNAMDPSSALRGRTLRNFYQSATPEQIDRMERVR